MKNLKLVTFLNSLENLIWKSGDIQLRSLWNSYADKLLSEAIQGDWLGLSERDLRAGINYAEFLLKNNLK
jgi:hypothetical protein